MSRSVGSVTSVTFACTRRSAAARLAAQGRFAAQLREVSSADRARQARIRVRTSRRSPGGASRLLAAVLDGRARPSRIRQTCHNETGVAEPEANPLQPACVAAVGTGGDAGFAHGGDYGPSGTAAQPKSS